MKSDDLIFINNDQRNRLKDAYSLIDEVYKEITINHEDYSIIKTTLYYLEKAITYEEKHY